MGLSVGIIFLTEYHLEEECVGHSVFHYVLGVPTRACLIMVA